MNIPNLPQIKEAYRSKGYTYFNGKKPYDLNLWGIRKQFGEINLFDDMLGVSYIDEHGDEHIIVHNATVDPGKYYLLTKLGNPDGTFILAPGQYRSCWERRKHNNKYFALCQKSSYKKFKGWRDNLLDGVLERKAKEDGTFFTDVIGLNMHRSSETFAQLVGQFSAACQVRQVNEEHKTIMKLVDKAILNYGNGFTYTLFDEEEVFGAPVSNATRGGKQVKVKRWPEDYVKIK
jgi:hypothetical protein